MTRAIAAALVAASLSVGCASPSETPVVGVRATGCRPFPERGSGVLVAVEGHDRPLVLTAAHVVAGANEITVSPEQTDATARVVAFDPDMDLAYLAVDRLDLEGVATVDSSGVDAGTAAIARVVRDGDPLDVPVTIVRRIDIRTEDLYVEGETIRPGFELTADIEEGDSGAPVVVDGHVVGIVWARSRATNARAYAVDPVRAGDRIRRQLDTGDLGDVDVTRCP